MRDSSTLVVAAIAMAAALGWLILLSVKYRGVYRATEAAPLAVVPGIVFATFALLVLARELGGPSLGVAVGILLVVGSIASWLIVRIRNRSR